MSEPTGRTVPLTVTVIVFSGPEALDRCLHALHAQVGVSQPEILVPCDDTLPVAAGLEDRYSAVRFMREPGRRTPAELRARAVREAAGEVVALVEDHCTPAADWCARILEAHDAAHAAIGGAVDKGFRPGAAHDTALDWAVYLTDYSRYMPPMEAGPAHSLTDCNVTYKRDALRSIADSWTAEFHENIVNDRLRAMGESLWFDPGILVYEFRPLTVSAAMRDRYSFGRLFAATRVEDSPLSKRLIYAAASCLMPPVLAWRAMRNLFSRGRHRLQAIRCAPALLFVASVWMFGEMTGYLTGSPGSLRPTAGPAMMNVGR